MVGTEQIRSGAMKYVTRELTPQMGKAARIGILAFAPTVIEAKIKQYISLLDGTPLVDGANVDIDAVYRSLKESAAAEWPVELFGFRFVEEDLDKLYRCIKEA